MTEQPALSYVMLSGGPLDGQEIVVDRETLQMPYLAVYVPAKTSVVDRPDVKPPTPVPSRVAHYRHWYSSNDGTRKVYLFFEERS